MIGIEQIGIVPKGQTGLIAKVKNWFKPNKGQAELNLGYEDWTDQQHKDIKQRLLKDSNIQSKSLNTIDNGREVFKHFGLQTTPQRDSTWTYTESGEKDRQVYIWKNSDTNDYIYSDAVYNHNGPNEYTETRVSKLPDKLQQLVNNINNEVVRK